MNIKNLQYYSTLLFVTLFTIVFTCSCEEAAVSTDRATKRFSVESMPKVLILEGRKHSFEQIIMPEKLLVKKNHLIIGEHPKTNLVIPPIHVIDHTSMEYQFSKGVIGFGPGEISDVWILDEGNLENTFWVYSATEKRFSEFSLLDTLYLSDRQIKQSGSFFLAIAMAWSSDTTVICRSANDEHQFVEYHIDGTRLGGYGCWKDFLVRREMNDFMMGDLHQGWFKGSQQKGIYVSAGVRRDRLEILHKKEGEIIMVDGPENRIPKFKIVSGPGQSPAVIVSADEAYTYRDVCIGDKFIYGLYCGRTNKQIMETNENAMEIYVFDFEGNIQGELRLDMSIRTLAVDEVSGKIFGVTTDEDPGIAVFDLPSLN